MWGVLAGKPAEGRTYRDAGISFSSEAILQAQITLAFLLSAAGLHSWLALSACTCLKYFFVI